MAASSASSISLLGLNSKLFKDKMTMSKKTKQIVAIVGIIVLIAIFAPGLFQPSNYSGGTYVPNAPSIPGQCGQPGLQPSGCPPISAKCADQNFNPVPCIASTAPLAVLNGVPGIYYIYWVATVTNNGQVPLDTVTLQTALNSGNTYDGDIFNAMKNGASTAATASNLLAGQSWAWTSNTPPCDSGEVNDGKGNCWIPLNSSYSSNYEANCASGCNFGVMFSATYHVGNISKTLPLQRFFKTYTVFPDPTASFAINLTSIGQ